MKNSLPTTSRPHIRPSSTKSICAGLLAMGLIGAALSSYADSIWNGSASTDWNTAANWSAGVPSGASATITTTNPRIATITSTISGTPVDINVGTGNGAIGRVDHIAGNAFTGNGNWLWMGYQGGNATYNLADTTTTGGTFTGYGMGSGNLYVGGQTSPTGNILLGLDNGTVSTMNVNSSGTIFAGYLCVGANGAPTSTVNMDNGNIIISGDAQVGGDQFGQSSGISTFNMSGGSLTANIIIFARGDNNSCVMQGTGQLTGGTLNSRAWFTLGFAGSSTAFAGLTNSGATINVNTNGGGNMEVTVFDPMSAAYVQNSGALNLWRNAYISFGNGGNNSGTGTFTQNGGTVTFYSDSGNTVGGTGYLSLGRSGDTGTYTYNLNGGTLNVPKIQNAATTGSSTFNFNGGTLKPTASSANFISFVNAYVQSGGAIVDTGTNAVTFISTMQDAGGGLTKLGNGTLTLSGGYTYSGTTAVRGGTLALDATLSSSSSALTVSNATLSISLNNGTATLNSGNITLQGNSAITLNYGTAATPSTAINASGYSVSVTGTNTININGQSLVVGQYPLIYTGSSVSTNNFNLGPLPTGMVAKLTNSGTSLDLLVISAGQNLTWYGADNVGNPLTTWDIGTSMNWNSGTAQYLQYSGNSYGDNVTFNDSVYPGNTSITLNNRVVPSTVNFNGGQSYTIAGTGGIDGPTSLNLNGGSLTLSTSNSYTGGTLIASGATLTITNDSALGNSSSGLTVAGGALQMNGTVTSTRPVALTANSTIGVGSGLSATVGGAVTGSGGLTKLDNGTLTLGGNNTFTGSTKVSAGTLNVPGTMSNGIVTVGDISGNAVLGISGNVAANSFLVGNASGAASAVNQTGGNLSVNGGGGDVLDVGNIAGGFGYYNAAGGTITANGIAVGGENNNGSGFSGTGGDGIMDINGATVNDTGWFVMSRGDSTETGILNMFSGSLSFAGGGLVGDWGSGQTMIVNVQGGSVTSTNVGIGLGSAGNTGILNLNGGLVSVSRVGGNFGGTFGQLNFNGGALQPAANTANFISVSQANVYSGGAIIDDGGKTVTIAQPLLAPVGYGVSTISLSDGGSGYIAPPIITIFGGLGSNATAIATVSGGVVTGITVTSPGNGYDVSDSLSVSFSGGGSGAVQPTVSAVNLAANTSGGLVKKGSGSLTLTGVNTYTGTTLVTNGTLFITPVQQTATPFIVADGKKLSIVASSTTNGAVIGNLTLGSVAGASLGISYPVVGNPTNVALTAAAVTVNGSSTIKLGGVFDIGVFPLLKYSSLSSLPALEVPRGTTAILSNDTVNTTLYVKVTAIGGGISWSGTTGLIPNLWDIDVTTNWLTGATPTTYQEATPPGDAVTFSDTGSGTVLVSNTVSPANVSISNSIAYSFSGSGQINSSLGLNKRGSGALTLSLPGTYSGSTVVSNGTISIGANQTFANLSGDSTLNVAAGNPTITINSSSNTTFAGRIQAGFSLTKLGNSTLTLSSNYTSGVMELDAGKIVFAASNSLTGDMKIGEGTGKSGTIDLVSGGFVSMPSTWFFVGHNNGTGTLNVSGNAGMSVLRLWAGGASYGDNGIGTVNVDSTGSIAASDGVFVGESWAGGYGSGTLNLTNGTITSGNEFWVGGDAQTGSTNIGTINQYGGSVTSATWMAIGRGGSGGNVTGTYNLFGGSVIAANGNNGSFATIGSFANVTGILNVSGGSFLAGSSHRIYVGEGGTGIVNVSGSGLVTCSNIPDGGIQLAGNGSATGTVNLNGGTIAAALISKGGGSSATFNFNGGTLKAVLPNTTFMQGLDAANVLTGGAVIDTAGNNIGIGQALINNGVNEDGGLTKVGNGTLLLNGVNTYTNVTTVSGGGLGGIGTIAGRVVANAGGGLAPANSGAGTLTINGDITLNAGSTNVFAVDGTTPANDSVTANANVTYGGVLKIVPTGTLTVGQTFTLFSGAGAANTSNFSSVQNTGAGTFTFTNGVLTVASVMASNPTNITFSVSGNSLSLSWPSDHMGWILQTNATSLTDSSAWFAYPGSSSTTSVSVPIDPGATNVFFRLIKP